MSIQPSSGLAALCEDGYVRLRDVAKFASCSDRTAARLVASGKLPSRRIGRMRLIRRADLLAFLAGDAVS